MNILYWADGFYPRVGGVETQSIKFTKGMQEFGHKYLVVAHQDSPNDAKEDDYEGIQMRRFDFSLLDSTENNRKNFIKLLEQEISHILTNFKPDIVHLSTNTYAWSAIAYLHVKKLFSCPTILTLHSIFLIENKPDPLLKRFVDSIHHICCVSKSVLNELVTYLPSIAQKSSLIYNGLPLPDICPLPLQFENPVILCLGRLTYEKCFDICIKAFAKIKENFPKARMIIAGDGVEFVTLQTLASNLNLKESIQFTGFVKYADVPHLINQCTIVLMPSLFESFGLAALEAAQMQRPVIASGVGGLPEVVLNQLTGIIIPPNNIDALYNAIVTLLENPDTTIQMGVEGSKRAIDNFSLKNVIENYQKIYLKKFKNEPDYSNFVSIIIAVYNGEKYLSETIESVLNQDYLNYELIIIDDGSTDGSAQIIQKYLSDKVISVRQQNQGQTAAWNHALSLAKYPLIAFLDADDIYLPNKLTLQVEILQLMPRIDMVFGHTLQFVSPELSDEIKLKRACPKTPMPGFIASVGMFRKECFNEIGLFSTEWKLGAFIDWYIRAKTFGLKEYLSPDVFSKRRIHDQNLGVTQRAHYKDYVHVLKANLDRKRIQDNTDFRFQKLE